MTPRDETITNTGWRVVGAARSLVEADAGMAPIEVRDDDTLFIARFVVRPWLGNGSAVDDVLGVLSAAAKSAWPDAPAFTRSAPVVRQGGRFDALRWLTTGGAGEWKGELFWRHPHPFIPGVPLVTHVVVEEQHRLTMLGVRVTADNGVASVRGRVGAGQARPPFLTALNRTLRVQFDGMDSAPLRLEHGEVEAFVHDVLLSETREYPVAILTPLEDDSFETDAQEFAEELLGLAKLYVIANHRSTYSLTDSLGDRRLSAYWGAIRVYMPEFSCADTPQDHPLLVRDRASDPVMRAELIGKLAHYATMRIRMPAGIVHDQPTRRAADAGTRTRAETTTRAASSNGVVLGQADDAATKLATPAVSSENDAKPDTSGILIAQVSRLAETITTLATTMTTLSEEMARLRTSSAVRAANTNSLERRLNTVAGLLERYFDAQRAPDPGSTDISPARVDEAVDAPDPDQQSLTDVVRQASSGHSDALLVLDSAERSAAASPYQDIERAAVILDAMADVARRRQSGTLQSSLRDAFRELGIEYRGGIAPSTSERLRRQYQMVDSQGRVFECHEHIAVGASYDPRHCLRIYFTSRSPSEARFVIGHVGRHFEVESST